MDCFPLAGVSLRIPPRPRRRRLGWRAALAALTALPPAGSAELDLQPYASARHEYHSNLFALDGDGEAITVLGDSDRDDMVQRYLVGLDASYQWSGQRLYGTIEGRELYYHHFDELDHEEHLVAGGLDWSITQAVDGKLSYREEERIADFADRRDAALSIETEEVATASAGLMITPQWRLEGELENRELESPVTGIPDFSLEERRATAGVKYLISEYVKAGVYVEQLDGEFGGDPNAGDFDQTSVYGDVEYVASGLSTVHATLGVSEREDDNNQTVSDVIGEIEYNRDLSVKTSLNAEAFRRISSFVGGASAVLETGLGGGITWKATEKTTVDASYQWTTNEFTTDFSSGAAEPDRDDDYHFATLALNYRPTHWFALRPYVHLVNRDSNQRNDSFESKVIGIEFTVRFGAD